MALRVPLHQSLYGRVALAYSVLLPILLAAQAAAVIVLANRRDHINRVERQERAQLAQKLALVISDRLTQSAGDAPLDAIIGDLEPHGRLFVVMRDGTVAGSRGPGDTEVREFMAGLGTLREFDRLLPAEWTNGDFTAAPITSGPRLLGMVAITPRTMFEQYGGTIIVLGASLLLVGNVILGWLVVKPIRARLRDLYAAASQLRDGQLAARASANGSDELAEVARVFNEMAAELGSRTCALETSNRLRRQLVADVTHELMTPLTSVLGRLEGLSMDDLQLTPEQRRAQVLHALNEARRLERLIGDLLVSNRLETGAMVMNFAPVSVSRLFGDLAARHDDECRRRGISLRQEIASTSLVADPFRLEQALDNLLVNALRHTPDDGRVVLGARDAGETVELTVWDSAGAIPPQHLPHVFDRFYKAASARGIASPGSGLGLSIVKAIAERHGGSVTATSSPERGTTFTMTVPRKLAVDDQPLAAAG